MPTSDRRTFLGLLSSVAGWMASRPHDAAQQPVVEARPTALFQQPDGRKNLVRVTVSGVSAPAARARVTDRHGALVGTAGLLPAPTGPALSGEVWVPLSEPADFQIDVEVGRDRIARRRLRLAPAKRWTLYWLSSIHTDVGYTDLQERALEVHRKNLDEALAWLAPHRDFRFTAECALQVLSYLENRPPDAGDALVQAIRDGRVGWQALFANMLTGILSHDTFARLVWPAGKLARERGLTFLSAQITDVPGQTLTFPMLLAASGVKYLASGPNPERAVPLLPAAGSEGTMYPQLYYWEAPDGSRVLHWRAHHYGDGTRFGFDVSPDEMGHRLSDWLLNQPAFLAQNWPYDIALLYGADWQDNALMKEAIVANVQEFSRRFTWPRIITGRPEDFFRDVERRYAAKIPVRRGDTGLYWEDGAASTAAELAAFRSAQLAARAAEVLALWDDRIEPRDDDTVAQRRERADARASMWRDVLLFGEHTWGAAESIAQPQSRQTVAQWEYKKRFLDAGAAAAQEQLAAGLLRLGHATRSGRGRIVFNAGTWERTDVARVPGGAGKTLSFDGRELAAVDLDNGDALVLFREVPALGYLALTESDRDARPPTADGEALDAKAGGFSVALDPATGAIRSLTGPDGKERVAPHPSDWSGLNQFVYARGGAQSALWTSGDRDQLKNPAQLVLTQTKLVRCRRERLPGIGVRLVVDRALEGFPSIVSTVTLYDELPWVDIENRILKTATLEKEALYIAFPFAFTKPVVDVEVPLGRMTVERDQQPGSCRDWYCHAQWVWMHEGSDGVLWSGPDTPLFTLNDLFRGLWRRTIAPDGTLFAYAMNNYWHTNYAASQGGSVTFRYRISLLAPGDAAEPVRRGWAACDPLYVSGSYTNDRPGPLIAKDRALFCADKGVMVVGAKPADDGEGVIVKLLDVSGQARSVGLWPAAYAYKLARRTTLVEQNGDAITVGSDGRASLDLAAWGVGAVRLFTPAEAS